MKDAQVTEQSEICGIKRNSVPFKFSSINRLNQL